MFCTFVYISDSFLFSKNVSLFPLYGTCAATAVFYNSSHAVFVVQGRVSSQQQQLKKSERKCVWLNHYKGNELTLYDITVVITQVLLLILSVKINRALVDH